MESVINNEKQVRKKKKKISKEVVENAFNKMHIKRVTWEQQEVLLSWLESNQDIATGRHKVDGSERDHWNIIARKLNKLGVEKEVKKWQQVWRDWKGNVRRKCQKLKQENVPYNVGGLSQFEERILALLGVDLNQPQQDGRLSIDRDDAVKDEPVESDYLEEREGSLGSDVPSCSWEIPSPVPVMDGHETNADNSTQRDDDPLNNHKSKSGLTRPRRKGPPYLNEHYLQLERRKLKLGERQLEQSRRQFELDCKRAQVDRRRLQVEREHVTALRTLSEALGQFAHILGRFESRGSTTTDH